jgi:AcrR family transcriptional regulator
MFKKTATKGETTRQQILDTALRLFRERGFEEATMREIATEADVAVGNAYYYFPSKEAIVLAYYDLVQTEHERRVHEAFPEQKDFKTRLLTVLHTKLDILKDDRPLLGALFRYTGQPDHPLSFLGSTARALQKRCSDLFAEAISVEKIPDDLKAFAPTLLWAMHMGLMLYFLYDKSAHQQRTRKLVNGSVDFVMMFLTLARNPLARPVRKRVMNLLSEAGLVEI